MIRLLLPLALACGEAPVPDQPSAPPTPPPEVAPPAAPTAPEATVVAEGGVLTVGPFTFAPVLHATTIVTAKGKVWWLDPWSQGELEGRPKADVVLITDVHPDHLDDEGIATVSKEETLVVAPAAVAQAWSGTPRNVLGNGQTAEVAGVLVTAVPMYNLSRGPEAGGLYHDKGRGNGYILELDGVRAYFAGDTACTDEMKALTDIDVAFIPMNLPYTMPPDEAAACVRAFQPRVAVPYHYRDQDPGEFERALADLDGVKVVRLDYYPAE